MRFLYPVLFLAALSVSCAKSDDGSSTSGPEDPPYVEPVPETYAFDQAVLTYYGDDTFSGVSDLWILELSDARLADGSENPDLAQLRLTVSLNVSPDPDGNPDPELLSATYYMPANSGDLSAGTFNTGYMTEQDRPNGAVSVPAGSFLENFPGAGESSGPDLLREGNCTVEAKADGSISVRGMLVGTEYLKRNFTYEGTPQLVDYSDGRESEVPNTNLEEDIVLTALTDLRIADKGDSYCLGDESYRAFEVYLADPGIDLSTTWPGGDGELLRIEIFVPWETTLESGIPAGTYSVPGNVPPYGIYREDIVPYRIVPGYPDKFTCNTGTWYQEMEAGKWIRYARIAGGTVTVERPDGGYRITADLTDCGSPAHHVRCAWESL